MQVSPSLKAELNACGIRGGNVNGAMTSHCMLSIYCSALQGKEENKTFQQKGLFQTLCKWQHVTINSNRNISGSAQLIRKISREHNCNSCRFSSWELKTSAGSDKIYFQYSIPLPSLASYIWESYKQDIIGNNLCLQRLIERTQPWKC